MSDEIKAYPDEYDALKTEMDTLRENIVQSFSDVNTRLLKLVSNTGPFYSRSVSAKVTGLLNLIEQDLLSPNQINIRLLSKYLCGFANGLNEYDKVSS